jgi:hypothetical protein
MKTLDLRIGLVERTHDTGFRHRVSDTLVGCILRYSEFADKILRRCFVQAPLFPGAEGAVSYLLPVTQ